MSEFKFACPVCGQHLTVDSGTSGQQLACPTCFQKIVVPNAPAFPDSKLILSAKRVEEGKVLTVHAAVSAKGSKSKSREALVAILVLLGFLGAAGAAVIHYRDEIVQLVREWTHKPAPPQLVISSATYPIPSDLHWSLNLTNVAFPDRPVAGSIHGEGFFCEKATLAGGTLTLRQGRMWPPNLGVTVVFVAGQAEELAGKFINIPAERPPPLPRVILRWKNQGEEPVTQTINAGYALKLAFGRPTDGRMPGKIYLCLPDDSRSFVAGTFNARIRPPRANDRQSKD